MRSCPQLPITAGAWRRHAVDATHPEIIYERGKCIMCDACVRIAAEAGEALGVTLIGRGFDITMAVPFDRPLSEGLRTVALRCADACPSGALAVRGSRVFDLVTPTRTPPTSSEGS